MLNVDDIIQQAIRITHEPVDVSDLSDEMAPEIVEETILARERQRIDQFLADRSDRLMLLRRIRNAAVAAEAEYKAEAERWMRRAKRKARLGDYCAELATNVLEAERIASGGQRGQAYRVELPDGITIGLRVTKAVHVLELDDLPGRFVRVRREADKAELGKRLKAGETVPGAVLVTNEHIDWGR